VNFRFSRLSCQLLVVALVCVVVGGPAGASASGRSSPPKRGAVGYDVGDLSCGAAFPAGGSFGVVGTTGGKPFHSSPCLAAEYDWAKGLTYRPQYYVNLANPGHKSTHWGRGGPRRCYRKPKYDPGCAYDYGYETAAAAWRNALSVGSNGHSRWWLDVEIDNTWGTSRAGVAANIADIQGALHYMRARAHTAVGIYTETTWWTFITDDSRGFAGTAVWGGGAGSKHNARKNCRKHSITGGPALLAQWIVGNVDHDIAC
jgi:hypothetical protein